MTRLVTTILAIFALYLVFLWFVFYRLNKPEAGVQKMDEPFIEAQTIAICPGPNCDLTLPVRETIGVYEFPGGVWAGYHHLSDGWVVVDPITAPRPVPKELQ